MFKYSKKIAVFITVLLVSVFVLTPFLRTQSSAATLGDTFLFLGRMKAGEQTDMVLLLTPSTAFNSGDDGRVLKIVFPGASGDWCQTDDSSLSVAGVSTSAINTGDWTIGAALPGTLVGKCFTHSGGDYIQVTGIDALISGTKYGLDISAGANFLLNGAGSHRVSAQLIEGTKTESITFEIVTLAQDQVTIGATVAPTDTLTCTIPTALELGSLFMGGAYISGTQTFSTNSTSPYYWAVYGTGGGASGNAGFWNSAGNYLISGAGEAGVVNLLTASEGFGLAISSSADSNATPATNYNYTTPGVFGSVGKGFDNARLILSTSGASDGSKSTTVVVGAKASTSAAAGEYQETLTYICGAYIGD